MGEVTISGRLANRDGQGVAGAEVQVLAASPIAPEQLVGVVHTDADGSFSYTAAGSTSRTLRFAYAGSPLMLPAESTVRPDRPGREHVAGEPPSRAQRPAGALQRTGAQPAGARGGQARPARGAAVGTLADVPHRANRRVRALGAPVPVRPHARRAVVPVPRVAAAPRRGYPFGAGASKCLTSAGEGALMYRWRRHVTGEGTVLNSLRKRLTYANVMSTLAVFIALGGSSYAAVKINGSSIKNRSIAGKKLRHNTLTGRQIRESRLGRVPYARNAGRLGGLTAAGAEDQVPERHVPDRRRLRRERRLAPPQSYGSAVLTCLGVGTPDGPGTAAADARRAPRGADRRAARAGRRADVERLPVELGPGPARRALRHRPGRRRRR